MGDSQILHLAVVEDDDHHAQDLRQLDGGQPVQDGHGDAHLGQLGKDLCSGDWSQGALSLPVVEEVFAQKYLWLDTTTSESQCGAGQLCFCPQGLSLPQ